MPPSPTTHRFYGSWSGIFQRFLRNPLFFVFLFALALRLIYLAEISGTAIWDWYAWEESDMDTFLKVARQILSGDWLVREPYHPYHEWQQKIAPAEEWSRWYGPHVFHQVPGYYYLLALMLKLFAGSIGFVMIVQMILGACHAALLGAVGKKVIGGAGGVLVGFMAASYGPFIGAEAMVLRDGIAMLLATFGFYSIFLALDLTNHGTPRAAGGAWLAAGLVLGLGAFTKETGFVLIAAIWLWVVGRGLFLPALLLLAGSVIGLSPIIVRNLIVGAGPLAFSPQGSINFVLANAADAAAGGVVFVPFSSFRAIMEQSQGRPVETVLATLQTYQWDLTLFFANVWAKFSAIWSNIEQPDNFSFVYLTLHSDLLRILPRFVCIWLLAALGIAVLALRWCVARIRGLRNHPATLRASSTGSLVYSPSLIGLTLFVVFFHVSAQSFAPVMTRYRLVVVPYLMLLAGWLLVEVVRYLSARRWARLGQMAVSFGILCQIWFLWPVNTRLEGQQLRPADFFTGARLRAGRSDFAGAYNEIQTGITSFRSLAPRVALRRELQLRSYRLELFFNHRRFDEVRGDWEFIQAMRNSLP